MADRIPIPKSVRFEVFKRDSFKCQYCGKSAPEVVLHIDHIKPIANGGDNHITNLITSCADCNVGKGARPLSDNAAVKKAKAQLDELQERREQLEMIMEWQRGLRSFNTDAIDLLCEHWAEVAEGYRVTETGRDTIRKWLEKFKPADIATAMTKAAVYLKRDPSGSFTGESAAEAFLKVSGICRVNQIAESDPDIRRLYYIRATLRKRMAEYRSTLDEKGSLKRLREARDWGVPFGELEEIVRQAWSWWNFSDRIDEAIKNAKYRSGQ